MATYNESCYISAKNSNITEEPWEDGPHWFLLFYQQCPTELAQLEVYFNHSGHDVRQVIDLLYQMAFDPQPYLPFREFLTTHPAYFAILIIAILAISGNIFCLTVMFRIRMALSGHRLFIISLCFSDAFISFCTILRIRQHFVNEQLTIPIDLDVCSENLLGSFIFAGFLLTLLNLIGMAIDHFIGILRPLYYCRWMSTRNTTLSIVAIWIVGIVAGCAPYLLAFIVTFARGQPMQRYCQLTYGYNFYYYPSIMAFSTPTFFGIVTFCYWRIFRKIDDLHRRTPRLLSQTEIRKATITTLLIVVSFALFWVPYCIYEMYQFIYLRIIKEPYGLIPWADLITVGKVTNILANLNALADPLIYTFRMAQIRSRMAHVLCIEAIRQRLIRRSRSGLSGLSAGFGHVKHTQSGGGHDHPGDLHRSSAPTLKPSQTVPNGLYAVAGVSPVPGSGTMVGSAGGIASAGEHAVGSDSMVMTPPNTLTTTTSNSSGITTGNQSASTIGGLFVNPNSRSNSAQSEQVIMPVSPLGEENIRLLEQDANKLEECQEDSAGKIQEMETSNEVFMIPIPKIKSLLNDQQIKAAKTISLPATAAEKQRLILLK